MSITHEAMVFLIKETLKHPEGAGSDLTTYDSNAGGWLEVSGNLDVTHLASDVLMATEPREINSYSELCALHYGSAVRTSDVSDTVVLRSDGAEFVNQSGHMVSAMTLWTYGRKPFTVLWEPLP